MIGLFFTGAYILKGIKQVLHGPLNEHWVGHLSEINAREILGDRAADGPDPVDRRSGRPGSWV